MMTTIEQVRRNGHAALPVLTARQIYLLLRESSDREKALAFLSRSLADVSALPCDLPADPADWTEWMAGRASRNEAQQQRYRDLRAAGAPRRYFANRPDARRFLSNAAPTLLSEGAWLYAVMRHWELEPLQPLVRVYLEYVGKGVPDWNRVLRARQLLTVQGCVQWQEQEDEHFVQGALRLALAGCGDEMLPELLGYQLGVSAQALYRPSVADELRELGIAAYLLTPPTMSDSATVECLQQLLPLMQDQATFLHRVTLGYRLHSLGAEPVATASTEDAAGAGVPLPPMDPMQEQAEEAPVRQRDHTPRPLIRHNFPEDEHAWESIDNELALLEAQVAASESQEDAMALLASRLAPATHHSPVGLMAGRLFTQLYD